MEDCLQGTIVFRQNEDVNMIVHDNKTPEIVAAPFKPSERFNNNRALVRFEVGLQRVKTPCDKIEISARTEMREVAPVSSKYLFKVSHVLEDNNIAINRKAGTTLNCFVVVRGGENYRGRSFYC
jgi:hypothetical protein